MLKGLALRLPHECVSCPAEHGSEALRPSLLKTWTTLAVRPQIKKRFSKTILFLRWISEKKYELVSRSGTGKSLCSHKRQMKKIIFIYHNHIVILCRVVFIFTHHTKIFLHNNLTKNNLFSHKNIFLPGFFQNFPKIPDFAGFRARDPLPGPNLTPSGPAVRAAPPAGGFLAPGAKNGHFLAKK